MKLETDGAEYEILADAVKAAKDVTGLICEIGTRLGGSMQIMIDAALESGQENRHFISVDPYGHILYSSGKPFGPTRFDYTNEMKKRAMADLFKYVQGKPVDFSHFCLTDTEFMVRFAGGVPVYNTEPQLTNKYASVYLDGPHDTASVLKECIFFAHRMNKCATVVIDNIDYLEIQEVIDYMESVDFEIHKLGDTKICFRCKY